MLVMEVSDTSLRYDSEEKSWLYAVAAIPEYWFVACASGGWKCAAIPVQ